MLKLTFIITCITLFLFGCSSNHFVSTDENIIAPKLIDKPLFAYPHDAQKNNFTGKVQMIIKIDKTGRVDSVILEKSSGHKILDNSAIAFVKQFKYRPAEMNGKAIQFYLKQVVNYYLAEENDSIFNYVKHVKNLKEKIEKASPEKQLKLQKELLNVYTDLINSNMDFIIFNQNIKKFVNKDSFNRWNDSTDDLPLHFIVFDDFQKSYPNSTINSDARNLMFEYLKKDFETVRVISTLDEDHTIQKEKFNQKINSFINEEYAGLLPDSLKYLIQ